MRRELIIGTVLTAACPAWGQTPDPVIVAITQEWQVAEIEQGHLSDALQKLVQAYIAQKKKEADLEEYWKAYVAGLAHQ